MVSNAFAIQVSEDDSFSQTEAPSIIEGFVCAVCHGPLNEIIPDNQGRSLIICWDHGNVCDCGRVTLATVSIEIENSIKRFYGAVLALPDLWPDVILKGFDREHAVKFSKGFVCAVCGGILIPSMKGSACDVACAHHGSIQICGHVKKEDYRYDYQAIRAWEKDHRRT